jgi:hypothetical protein
VDATVASHISVVCGLTTFAERKTGVKNTEVITARLVLHERGWLRLGELNPKGC